jgi:altronate hydrolase
MKPNALLIDPLDNVVTVLRAVPCGGTAVWAEDGRVVVHEEIPTAHKVAIEAIALGAVIRKYGHPIGTAGEAIASGDRVHIHNLKAVES